MVSTIVCSAHCHAVQDMYRACNAHADNPLVIGVVGALTEALRVLGVGKEEYEKVLSQPPQAAAPTPGDKEEARL